MTTTTVGIAVEIFLLAGIMYVLLRCLEAGRTYFKLRGRRLVTCPETNRPAAIELDAKYAALTAVFGRPELRISRCSRWPERRNCGECCLKQIESAQDDILVRNTVVRWYAGTKCVYCQKPIAQVDHAAIVGRDGRTVEWEQVPAQELADVFATHFPVCWSCHAAQVFRRQYPGSVIAPAMVIPAVRLPIVPLSSNRTPRRSSPVA